MAAMCVVRRRILNETSARDGRSTSTCRDATRPGHHMGRQVRDNGSLYPQKSGWEGLGSSAL